MAPTGQDRGETEQTEDELTQAAAGASVAWPPTAKSEEAATGGTSLISYTGFPVSIEEE
jgi:hypothetical protein